MRFYKKALSLLIVLTILITSIFNVFTFNISAAVITTVYINGSGVRVRTAPSLENSSIIEQISYTSATVLETLNRNGEIWYKITYHNGSQQIEGYIKHMNYTTISTYNPDASFEEKLNAFPESYRNALRSLHSLYPNWNFIPDPVATSFDEAVYQQSINMRKQVSFSSHPVSWRSMGQGSYDWNKNQWILNNGGWTGASREIIAYYMDPRNFLTASSIYQFLQQGYNPTTQTEEGVQKIVAGSFLANGYSDVNDTAYGGSYVKVIMEAARQSNVSPYVIASKIIQEQGVNGSSSLISGSYGYYNFFNIGASGSTKDAVIENGIKRAKEEGWNTRSLSIIGGAKFLSNNYIAKGQDTYYYQDFNVHNPNNLWHQYAQAVHDAYNKGVNLADSYKDFKDLNLSFKIPVFTAMPSTVSQKPVESSLKNNYYLSNAVVPGLTPSFSMYNYYYDLNVSSDSTIYINLVSGARYNGFSSYKILKGITTVYLPIVSETGYTTNYAINVSSNVECTLNVVVGTPTGVKGDTNGDGNITLSDLANVRLHLLGLFTLSGDNLIGADTNSDGNITLSDLANIRLHLLGLYTIS